MPTRLTLLLLTALAGCGLPTPSEELRVAAASDLQAAMPAIEEQFHRETGWALRVTFGSSGHLAQQLEQGAALRHLPLCQPRVCR